MRSRLLLTALALALFAFALARLRQVARPRFEPDARYARGRVVAGRVVLARGGRTVRLIGYSVTCGGHEVLANLGPLPPTLVGDDGERVVFRTADGSRVATITAADCSVAWRSR
jgi:hypothetical protein